MKKIYWRGIFFNADARAIFLLALFPLAYFYPVTFAQGVWFAADLLQQYYPYAREVTRALAEGRLALWTTGIQAGFPLLAEGLAGALYPPNLILYKLLPTAVALSQAMLLHLIWASIGMYACVRAHRLNPASAFFAGFAFAFGGIFLEQIVQPAILYTIAWLPWLIYLQIEYRRARQMPNVRAPIWFLLNVAALGIQFVAGSVQMAFYNAVTYTLFGLIGGVLDQPRGQWRARIDLFVETALPIVLGGGIAAIQFLPTIELVGYSGRSGGVSYGFSAGYALPPEFLPQFLFPFAAGEPSNLTNEFHAYFGIIPLVLAAAALFLRRDRRIIFYALFALMALSLSLGDLNPLYPLLQRVPLFNFFRVPARFTVYFVFAAGLLVGFAFDELTRRIEVASKGVVAQPRWASGAGSAAALPPFSKIEPSAPSRWLILPFVLTALAIFLAYSQPIDFWMRAWNFLPLFFLGVLLFLLWRIRARKISRGAFLGIALGLTLFDLAAYASPFLGTLDALAPVNYLDSAPRSLAALDSRDRLFTQVDFIPSVPAIRASLYPDTSLIFQRDSASVYSSLGFARYREYLSNLTPALLNLLNVRDYLIPLDPRRDGASLAPPPNLALDVIDHAAVIPATKSNAIEIVAFTDQASDLPPDFIAGELQLRRADGGVETFLLRLGQELADWDHDRVSALGLAQYPRAPVARTVPAFNRAFARAFDAYTYRARFEFKPSDIVGVQVRSNLPPARLIVESITLMDGNDRALSLAALTGKNDFHVTYLSDTVAVWRNANALPRAFIAHNAEIVGDDAIFARLRADGFQPQRVVLLAEGKPLTDARADAANQDAVRITRNSSERVEIAVSTDRAGYLVLADSFLPGWTAAIDERPAPIYRADAIFRAVPVEAGSHMIVFEYRPVSLMIGALVSAASIALSGLYVFGLRKKT
ncbi:MAG: YfhO family protein [Chloroflexi bacterium]|nr:YfhO family protein [Chloroflexota bacterium]